MPDEPAVSPTPEEPAPVKVPEPPDAPKTEIPALSNQDEPATAREVEQLTQRTEGPLQRRLLAALASSVSGARASRRVLLRLRLLWPLALLFLCGALLGVATVLFGLPRQAGGWALLTWSVLAVVIVVPRLQAIHFAGTNHREKDWAEVDNSARQTLLQIGGGVVVVVGVVTAYLEYQENAKVSRENLAVASQSLALTEASQRRERFGRALDQLGSDQMALRLAGIFGLEGVSREAGSDQWAVAEILTAYVRTHATRTAPPRSEPRHILQAGPRWPGGVDAVQVAQDVQAALTVLGRNPWPPGFEVVAPSRSTEYYRRYLVHCNG